MSERQNSQEERCIQHPLHERVGRRQIRQDRSHHDGEDVKHEPVPATSRSRRVPLRDDVDPWHQDAQVRELCIRLLRLAQQPKDGKKKQCYGVNGTESCCGHQQIPAASASCGRGGEPDIAHDGSRYGMPHAMLAVRDTKCIQYRHSEGKGRR